MSYFSKTPVHSILCAKAFLLKSCPKRQTPLLSLSLNLVLIILSNQLRCKIEENQQVVLLSQGKKPQDSHSSLLCPLEWPRTQLIHKNQKFSVQQHILFIFLEIQVSYFAALEESLQSLGLLENLLVVCCIIITLMVQVYLWIYTPAGNNQAEPCLA